MSGYWRQIHRIEAYMIDKYNIQKLGQKLSTHQAICEMGLSGGRELSRILSKGTLSSLNTKDIAQYIVIHQ